MKKITFALFTFFMIIIMQNRAFAATASICTKDEITELLQGTGINITNLELIGMPEQFGKFDDADDIPGFDNVEDGVVLSTGRAEGMFVPAYNFISTSYCAYTHGGDFDVASIEFDAVSDSNYISFQYIFASEEFDQHPMFNDLIHIEYKKAGEAEYTNIALLPDSTEDICINNIRNTKYHYDNIVGTQIGYLGYTSLLSCQADVEPEESYHFKITIKDLGDPIYDSAVFLKAHSATDEEAPEPEENPDPPSREPGTIELTKDLTNVRITLSTGKVLGEIDLKDEDATVNKEGFTVVDEDLLLVTVDDLILHGATIEAEYNIKIKNLSGDACIKYDLKDKKSDNFVYRLDGKLMTDDLTNSFFNWRYTDEDDIKFIGLGDMSMPAIMPMQTIEKKIVLSRVLTPDSDVDDIFTNSIEGKFVTPRETIERSDEAMKINVLPPFGNKSNNNMNFICNMGATILSLAIIGYVVIKF